MRDTRGSECLVGKQKTMRSFQSPLTRQVLVQMCYVVAVPNRIAFPCEVAGTSEAKGNRVYDLDSNHSDVGS
jgi:hypothetical protein